MIIGADQLEDQFEGIIRAHFERGAAIQVNDVVETCIRIILRHARPVPDPRFHMWLVGRVTEVLSRELVPVAGTG